MKTLLIILLSTTLSHASIDTIGWHVVERVGMELITSNTADIDSVKAICDRYEVEVPELFLEYRNGDKYLYIEKRRVVVRKGKVIYKRIHRYPIKK